MQQRLQADTHVWLHQSAPLVLDVPREAKSCSASPDQYQPADSWHQHAEQVPGLCLASRMTFPPSTGMQIAPALHPTPLHGPQAAQQPSRRICSPLCISHRHPKPRSSQLQRSYAQTREPPQPPAAPLPDPSRVAGALLRNSILPGVTHHALQDLHTQGMGIHGHSRWPGFTRDILQGLDASPGPHLLACLSACRWRCWAGSSLSSSMPSCCPFCTSCPTLCFRV